MKSQCIIASATAAISCFETSHTNFKFNIHLREIKCCFLSKIGTPRMRSEKKTNFIFLFSIGNFFFHARQLDARIAEYILVSIKCVWFYAKMRHEEWPIQSNPRCYDSIYISNAEKRRVEVHYSVTYMRCRHKSSHSFCCDAFCRQMQYSFKVVHWNRNFGLFYQSKANDFFFSVE